MKNDQSLTLSASAPETMDAAVATKTIWKNQSDMVEYPSATTSAAASSVPFTSETSSAVGPYASVKVPT